MYTSAEMLYTLVKSMQDDRIRQAEHARRARAVVGPRSGLPRWLQSLMPYRPPTPDPPAAEPQPEVPVEDPWREAA
ncbi:MAG: hypothetical protein ACR2JP_03945 [Acidimicrobiia bacterium]